MGIFSWETSDSKQSIRVHDTRKVYLLQPNGQQPIAESFYDGYGRFGGHDAYVWLFEHNKHLFKGDISELEFEDKRTLAIYMSSDSNSSICRDMATGALYHVFEDLSPIVPAALLESYSSKVPGTGKTVNELLDSGRLTRVPMTEFIQIQYPLKFSFNPNACYERLAAAEPCPWQGMPPDNEEDA
jgi:hypothetical protein